ncbi:MAG: gamma-glutamylcyclotransferase family protein [Marinobacter sp.]|uniref:gamma-glutamylcyclotransferase family protein n=1 Tax=Marinobacter sp. TaxID=50741 RepID=UPI0032990CB8
MSLNRVGVYGTLKKGHSNHHFMATARFVGRCRLKQITLYDIGPFPGAKLRPSQGIDVEIYDVTNELFARLDQLEGHNPRAPRAGEYDRRQLETPFGLAWIYLYNRDVSGLPAIQRGGWRMPTASCRF